MNILFTPQAFEDYKYWQTENRKTLKKINTLLEDICRNGYQGIGKPEALKGVYSGFWSRRIDEKNRLVYKVGDGVTIVIACRTHYQDK